MTVGDFAVSPGPIGGDDLRSLLADFAGLTDALSRFARRPSRAPGLDGTTIAAPPLFSAESYARAEYYAPFTNSFPIGWRSSSAAPRASS